MITKQDYIITGSGCAGLSLLMYMMEHSYFWNKKILVIDKSPKNTNDRTWCFWEQHAGLFEPIIHHRWQQFDFYSNTYSARFDIMPYQYKMIRSIDFYQYVRDKSKQHKNIQFYYGDVHSIKNKNGCAVVSVDDKTVEARYVFNSIPFDNYVPSFLSGKSVKGSFLLQHFKGWLIETELPFFDELKATFMDFRTDQKNGTTFVYVLPVSTKKALIEYTLFSEKILTQAQYDDALKDYIHTNLKLETYKILEVEFGVIPMTDHKFSEGEGRVVNIGTAGGQTKASSGFTFQFIQKHSAKITTALVSEEDPHIKKTIFQRRYDLYDSTLLEILCKKKMGGDKIFASLFKNNSPQTVLKFLDNETSLSEELKIMRSVPTSVFFPVALKKLLKSG